MHSLYTFRYLNKYHDELLECEFLGKNLHEAQMTAVERCNFVDDKYSETPYAYNDFTFVSKDDTFISSHKNYKTRNGLRVNIHEVNVNSTTNHNSVKGHIYFLNNKGEEKKRGSYFVWSINGRYKAAGKDELDLVEVLS